MDPYNAPLQELIGKNLEGWTIVPGYILYLAHGLAGFHPIVHQERPEQPVLCLKKSTLGKIWPAVRRHYADILTCVVLVNPDGTRAYDVSDGVKAERTPMHITSPTEVADLHSTASPFRWADGVVALCDERNASDPDFTD